MTKSKTVWKYEVPIDGASHHFEIPTGATVLQVGRQPFSDNLSVWCEVDPSVLTANRYLQVFGTGHEIPKSAEHWGTAVDGDFVWHLYRIMPGDRL